MKRVIIICEGQTEQEFCNDVLQPHLNKSGIFVQAPKIKKTGGGIVKWDAFYKEILLHLRQNKYVLVLNYLFLHQNTVKKPQIRNKK